RGTLTKGNAPRATSEGRGGAHYPPCQRGSRVRITGRGR
ncbi:hypothetical protein ALC57_18117, partial [Trachymyrmex cornetzi]